MNNNAQIPRQQHRWYSKTYDDPCPTADALVLAAYTRALAGN